MDHAAAPVSPYRKAAGPIGWALAIVTGVAFIGLLYNGASHGEGGHADAAHADAAHGAEAPAGEAKPAAH